MFPDKEECFEVGTFKLGQDVYLANNVVHTIYMHKECDVCNNTGAVMLSEKSFKCPNCNGTLNEVKIHEKIVREKPIKIKSVISFKDKHGEYEYYTDNDDRHGIHILIKNNNRSFPSREKAQEACNQYNETNNVKEKLEEYRNVKTFVRENIIVV